MWLVELAEADEEIQNHQGQILLTIYYFWKLRTPKTRRFDFIPLRFVFFVVFFGSCSSETVFLNLVHYRWQSVD